MKTCFWSDSMLVLTSEHMQIGIQGWIQDFKLGGRTQHNRAERSKVRIFLGYFMWKITILRQKKSYFFQFWGGWNQVFTAFRLKRIDPCERIGGYNNWRIGRCKCVFGGSLIEIPFFKGHSAVRAHFGPQSDLYNFYVYCILITLFCLNTKIGMIHWCTWQQTGCQKGR